MYRAPYNRKNFEGYALYRFKTENKDQRPETGDQKSELGFAALNQSGHNENRSRRTCRTGRGCCGGRRESTTDRC